MKMFLDKEYIRCISDLISIEDIKKLELYSQHMKTNRLYHSISVSYYTYKLCKKLGLDYRAGARSGLLHDFFLYDHKTEKVMGSHLKSHPKVALKNSKKYTKLTKVEKDAIKKHMWPITSSRPKFKESYILTIVDKYCAFKEVYERSAERIFKKS